MLTIYDISVQEHKIIFHGSGREGVIIDRFRIESETHAIKVGWIEVWICDYLLYKGPYPWFLGGGIGMAVPSYANFKIVCHVYDEDDKWFHGSHVRFLPYMYNGNLIDVSYTVQSEKYTK